MGPYLGPDEAERLHHICPTVGFRKQKPRGQSRLLLLLLPLQPSAEEFGRNVGRVEGGHERPLMEGPSCLIKPSAYGGWREGRAMSQSLPSPSLLAETRDFTLRQAGRLGPKPSPLDSSTNTFHLLHSLPTFTFQLALLLLGSGM